MKLFIAVLLLANIGVGLWGYTQSGRLALISLAYHPSRLKRIRVRPVLHSSMPSSSAQAMLTPAVRVADAAGVALGRPDPASPSLVPTSIRDTQCWQIGPVPTRLQAQHLLSVLHIKGEVVKRLGHVRAYRLYLSARKKGWPSTAALARAGVHGAYVTTGPRGGRVLSLAVFDQLAAANHYQRYLRRHGFATQRAGLTGPPRYFARAHLGLLTPRFWAAIGAVSHHACQ